MQYEIVSMPEKTVVGLNARTSNQDADMSATIGGLWKSFFEEGVYTSIQNKAAATTLGLYSNYAGDEKDAYDVTICCEVSSAGSLPEGTVQKTIPAGKYAKFIVIGDPVKDVMQFWSELWKMQLDRAFVCDYEEYITDGMEGPCEVHMYISLK